VLAGRAVRRGGGRVVAVTDGQPAMRLCDRAGHPKLASFNGLLGAAVGPGSRCAPAQGLGWRNGDRPCAAAGPKLVARLTGQWPSPTLPAWVDALGGRPWPPLRRSPSTSRAICRLLGSWRLQRDRRGRFTRVLAVATPVASCWRVEGSCEGTDPGGNPRAGGFGFDTVLVPALGLTLPRCSRSEAAVWASRPGL